MKRKTILTFPLAILAGLCSLSNCYGWNSYGHMEVACAAYNQLTPQIRQRANDLIKLNPNYKQWAGWVPSGTSADVTDEMIFMMAATWPDEIKSQAGYSNDGSDDGDRPDGSPNASANTGYDDKLRHKYWHFVDTPFTRDGSQLPAIPTPNAGERIALFRGVLASGSDDNLKSYDLCWLLHLVGDVHQPLHCTTRVSSADLDGDSGGNDVTLDGSPDELHAFWDAVLGTGSDKTIATAVIKAAGKLAAPDATLAAETSEQKWIQESFQIAETNVYISPIESDNGPFTLTSSYKKAAKTLAQKQVALAGARLANLLNSELK
jgi:hypothetical protein